DRITLEPDGESIGDLDLEVGRLPDVTSLDDAPNPSMGDPTDRQDGGTVLQVRDLDIEGRPARLVIATGIGDFGAHLGLGELPPPDPVAAEGGRVVELYVLIEDQVWFLRSQPAGFDDQAGFDYQEGLVLAVAESLEVDAEEAEVEAEILRLDGIGEVDLGTDPEGAVDAITDLLGPPTFQGDPFLGNLCQDPSRSVIWLDGAVGVEILVPAGASEQLVFWSVGQGGEALRLTGGLGLGSTVAELQGGLGDFDVQPAEIDGEPIFLASIPDDDDGQTLLYFDGLSETSPLTYMSTGRPCSGE
ncbi:MAG TPA: hypothetical protein VGO60_04740, partial [Iamia sp.]|nr:hypothetical protein [Iamia sp.]